MARLDEEDRLEYLPRIPVQPVGYTDAEQLLMRMEGEPAPEDWQGGLDIVYKYVETSFRSLDWTFINTGLGVS